MGGRRADPAAAGRSAEVDVFLALGSNIAPERHLRRAVEELARRFRVLATSRIYESEPVGSPGSPAFLNAAVRIRTDLLAAELKFGHLRRVEALLARRRTEDPNAARTIDIDLVLYGTRVLELPELGIHVPDPDILRHAHLALPLAELAPRFEHPVTGRTLAEIADSHGTTPRVRVRDDLRPLSRTEPPPTRS